MAKRDPIEQARHVRAKRAEVLAELKEGTRSLREELLHPQKYLSGAPVYTVLEAAQGMGPETTKDVLLAAKVWPLICMGDLTQGMMNRIVENLPERIQ